jgi:phage terminase small subunit
MTDRRPPLAPKHLRKPTRDWFDLSCQIFVMEPHHLKILLVACEAWDTGQRGNEALRLHGLVYTDRFGQPHARPEVAIVRDAMSTFMRAVRELRLDVGQPAEDERPPRLVERRA